MTRKYRTASLPWAARSRYCRIALFAHSRSSAIVPNTHIAHSRECESRVGSAAVRRWTMSPSSGHAPASAQRARSGPLRDRRRLEIAAPVRYWQT